MKDELEDFIRKNRDAFDDRDVPRDAWSNISKRMTFATHSLWNSVALWRAAAIVFMVISGYSLISISMSRRSNAEEARAGIISLNEFRDVEAFYIKQISDKVMLIDNFKSSDGLNGFTHDFHQLEAMYMVLKEEMKSSPSDKVKDALVLNLLVRINLLNQQLHKLEGEDKSAKKQAGRSA